MKTQQLKKFKHDQGYTYIARTNHPELSSHRRLSMAVLLENGVPLPGPSNTLHDEIRNLGYGRYSFWYGEVFFSTSDNSDPRTNNRLYSIKYVENEWSRFSFLFLPFQKVLKILYPVKMPAPLRHFFMGLGHIVDSIRSLGLLYPFWTLFYWLSFFYVASIRRLRLLYPFWTLFYWLSFFHVAAIRRRE